MCLTLCASIWNEKKWLTGRMRDVYSVQMVITIVIMLVFDTQIPQSHLKCCHKLQFVSRYGGHSRALRRVFVWRLYEVKEVFLDITYCLSSLSVCLSVTQKKFAAFHTVRFFNISFYVFRPSVPRSPKWSLYSAVVCRKLRERHSLVQSVLAVVA